jgi:Cohesin domain
MMSNRWIARRAPAAAVALFLLVLPACGGSSSTTNSGPVARFTPDSASPAAGTIAMLEGGHSGASVSVRVVVTGVDTFFGTAFRVSYDPAALLFTGWDYSNSFLLQGVGVGDVSFLEDHLTTPGTIVITATRLDPTMAPPVNVGATADLVVLNFAARKTLTSSSMDGRVDFADPRQVCDGTQGCGAVAVTWSGGLVTAR